MLLFYKDGWIWRKSCLGRKEERWNSGKGNLARNLNIFLELLVEDKGGKKMWLLWFTQQYEEKHKQKSLALRKVRFDQLKSTRKWLHKNFANNSNTLTLREIDISHSIRESKQKQNGKLHAIK